MTAPKVRADHDSLAQIAQNFNRESESNRQALQNIKQKLDVLQSGDWVGKGATKFYNEMNGAVLPALTRLVAALEQAGRITQKISQLMRQTEDQAAGVFRADGGGAGATVGAGGSTGASSSGGSGGSTASGGGSTGGTSGGGSGGSSGGGAGAGGGANWQQQNPLLARDPRGLFTDQYFNGMLNSRITGADSSALQNAMRELTQNPRNPSDAVLQRIADARGRPVSEIRAEHQRFLQLLAQQESSGNTPVVPLNESRYPNFMGSTTQMRYGQMIGDAFGVDPVFGSMLNPTGGIVGPDNGMFDGDSTAVGLHGIAHDAGGYLYNYHNRVGPGYDYLNQEHRDPSDSLTGHRAGIQYWRNRVGDDVVSRNLQRVAEIGTPIADTYNSARSWVSDRFNSVRSIF